MTSSGNQSWDPQEYSKHARFVSDFGTPVLALLAPQAGERILDLGCGDGELTKKLFATGCEVIAVDASPQMVAAARTLGLDARVADGRELDFENEFDAVFSNAAIHWMKPLEDVISSVWRALKPRGRFVGECGGYGNVDIIMTALAISLEKRGINIEAVNPWYFPTVEDYRRHLEDSGFIVNNATLIPRPTPLPSDMAGWLETFAKIFLQALPTSERQTLIEEVTQICRPKLCDADGKWVADYVRLRFSAYKPVGRELLNSS